MSAGSRTNPGGYASEPESLEQFAIDDDSSPAEVAAYLRSQGYEPVWKDWDQTYDGFCRGEPASARLADPWPFPGRKPSLRAPPLARRLRRGGAGEA